MVLGYNTNLVKRADVPKSYDDLLQPKWKGQMYLDNEAYDWFAVLLKHFGREKGLQYMRALAKQDLTMMRGRTAQAQLLVAGERPIGIVQSGNTMLDYKAKGAPVDMSILDPYLALANSIMLAKHALHPHAAALLIDWSLSEEGQSDGDELWPRRVAQRRQTKISRADGKRAVRHRRRVSWADARGKRQGVPADFSRRTIR